MRSVASVFQLGCLSVLLVACTTTERRGQSTAIEGTSRVQISDARRGTIGSNKSVRGKNNQASPKTIKQACEVAAVALEQKDLLPSFFSVRVQEVIKSLAAPARAKLLSGFREELFLVLPNVLHRSLIDEVGPVFLATTRTTNADGPNFIARWYVSDDMTVLQELEVEEKGWPSEWPSLIRIGSDN